MTVTIQKWGNSLAVRLPRLLVEDARLGEGTEVELVQTTEGVLLKRKAGVRYRLQELVARITAGNVHSEVDWGTAQGREIME